MTRFSREEGGERGDHYVMLLIHLVQKSDSVSHQPRYIQGSKVFLKLITNPINYVLWRPGIVRRRRRVTLQAGHSLIQIFTARALLPENRANQHSPIIHRKIRMELDYIAEMVGSISTLNMRWDVEEFIFIQNVS